MSTTTSFLVRKGELATTQLHTATDQPLADGQVRVRIDSFALTSNNITYAAFGDAMSYWQFFPSTEEGWGSIPVWGFASVVQSLHPGVAVGERLYGYWPMSSGAVLSQIASRPGVLSTPPRTVPSCPRSITSTSAATPIRSTPRTPKTCRCCCARCSSPRG